MNSCHKIVIAVFLVWLLQGCMSTKTVTRTSQTEQREQTRAARVGHLDKLDIVRPEPGVEIIDAEPCTLITSSALRKRGRMEAAIGDSTPAIVIDYELGFDRGTFAALIDSVKITWQDQITRETIHERTRIIRTHYKVPFFVLLGISIALAAIVIIFVGLKR